jgi:hypothetical protein
MYFQKTLISLSIYMTKTRRNRQRGGGWFDNMTSTVTGAFNSAKSKWAPGQSTDPQITSVPILNNGSDIPPIGGRYRRSRRTRRSRVRKWR